MKSEINWYYHEPRISSSLMSRDGSRKDLKLKVFDFDDSEQSELISQKYLQKFRQSSVEDFRTPKPDNSPATKYQFLKTFSSKAGSHGKKMSFISIDLETSESNHKCKDDGANALNTTDCTDRALEEATSLSDERGTDRTIPLIDDEGGSIFPACPTVNSFEAPCCNDSLLVAETSDQLGNNNEVDVLSDDDESEPCSSGGIKGGSLEGSASDSDSDDWEMGDTNRASFVVVPDYLIYNNLYSTDSSLSFCCSCIKLKGINAYGSKEEFSYEWGTNDVIGIESNWISRVETTIVKLQIRSDADLEGEVTDATSGIVELKFAVNDPHWFESLQKIMLLDSRYKALWTNLVDTDASEDPPFVQRNQRKHYLTTFDEPFEEVIYPKGDPDAVSISKRDVELLQPETFINDTIIDFYIKYLKNNISPEKQNRFHFFNSFFFRKLADLDKNPSSASEGRAAFLRVRKWTRKVNLFEKDYIFIPVNFNLHWSLIVICHPGEVVSFKEEEVVKSLKVPCILHMDSIKGSHKGLKNLVQSYLWEEWRERQPEAPEDVSPNFFNLRFVSLELPQQENSFDCGLFLLHYVELFLEEAPGSFNPFRLSMSSDFLHMAWFPPSEASLKRTLIQKLIYELLIDNSEEILPGAEDKGHQGFPFMDNHIKKETGVDFFNEHHMVGNSCHDLLSCPNDNQGIQMELLGNPGATDYVQNSGLVLELFDAGTTVGSFPDGQCEPLDQLTSFNKFNGVVMHEKGDEESGKQFPLSSLSRMHCQSLDAYSVGDVCTTSSLLRSFEICDTIPDSVFLAGQKREDHDDYIPLKASNCGSQGSSEVMVDEDLPVSRSVRPSKLEVAHTHILVSPNKDLNLCPAESSDSGRSEDGLDTRIVEDSQEVDRAVNDGEKQGSLSYCQQENVTATDDSRAQLVENVSHLSIDAGTSDDIIASDTVERAAKRPRLVLPVE